MITMEVQDKGFYRAGVKLQHLGKQLMPEMEAKIREDGELILERLRGHIDSQDLGWTPLSPKTVALKGGDTTIYVETGTLRNGLTVRKIKSSNSVTIFVGASPWKRHKKGMPLSQLMIWLEYGTDKMPARPLIEPTSKEVEGLLKQSWDTFLKDLIND